MTKKAVVASVKEDILSLVGATDFRIVAENGEGMRCRGKDLYKFYLEYSGQGTTFGRGAPVFGAQNEER